MIAYEKSVALEPENAIWLVSLADATAAAGDLQGAFQEYSQAVQMSPGEAATWRALAVFCLENDTEVANSGLIAGRSLLKLAPEDWLSYDIAGQIAVQIAAYPEAEKHLLKAIELAPTEPAPHFHLAQAYLESGQAIKAYDMLLDTLALDPEGPFGWQADRYLELYYP
jgi:predicted Zn-dependent protease